MIALLCSIDAEARPLIELMDHSGTVIQGSKELVSGTLEGRKAVICTGGMGKANAAHAATLLIAGYRPDALIIFGIGGAYPASGAKVGDVAIAEREIAGDEGVLTADGFKDTQYIGIPLLRTADAGTCFNTFPAPAQLLNRMLAALRAQTAGPAFHAGAFVTLSTCTGTAARADELEQRYHALCENMEGAAAAQVAMSHGIPWLEVRGISNLVEDRNRSRWDIPRAAAASRQAVLQVLKAWQP